MPYARLPSSDGLLQGTPKSPSHLARSHCKLPFNRTSQTSWKNGNKLWFDVAFMAWPELLGFDVALIGFFYGVFDHLRIQGATTIDGI